MEHKPLTYDASHVLDAIPEEVIVIDDERRLQQSAKRKRLLKCEPESPTVSIPNDDVQKSIYHFTKAYNDMRELNATLEMKLQQKDYEIHSMKQSHGQNLAAFERKIQGLLKDRNESDRKLKDLEIMLEELEQLSINENQTLLTHNEKTELIEENERQMRVLSAKKDKERQQALADVKQQYEQECSAMVEEAKGKKYCIGCGYTQPNDIYVCNMKCLQRACKKSQ
ncbi:uncharacterized protein LOC129570549 [Sitodiplosis mosellana]|uniref:uncharacterized protein LOC129570549 n=1 Tax=Sitodiplosis mosellana TaxID=263140 RepID=UPI002443A778|nr:uncharacterized protein LOC129570549 [Sitodiplosis mosellana]